MFDIRLKYEKKEGAEEITLIKVAEDNNELFL